MSLTTPNGHAPAPTSPRPLFVLQVALLDNGQVALNTPPGAPALDSVERVGVAALALQKAQTVLASANFAPAGPVGVEVAPAGTRVERNPRA